MIILDDISKCTGCGLCADICPHTAIEMISDKRGFKYPQISNDKCTECGACRKVCPQNSFNPLISQTAFAAFSKDENIRMSSSSGGIFTEICRYIIDRDGFVCGVKYDKNWLPAFDYADTLEKCEALKVSKYAEADLCTFYPTLTKLLNTGKSVLFSGTPCQTAAIKTKFSKFENLFTIDLICNSVPSRKIFNDFLRNLEKKVGRIEYLNMRYKNPSWESSSYLLKSNKQIIRASKANLSVSQRLLLSYRDLFFSHLSVRESCFKCKYRNINRAGDLSLGDFWRINSVCPEMNDGKGTSIILANTKKGRAVLDYLNIDVKEVEICNVQEHTCIPLKNSNPNKRYNEFWKDYIDKGYEYVAKKYTVFGTRVFIRHNIGNFIRKILKVIRG